MNKHHAQQLLIDYRPGLSEPTREVKEALALAERDPELNEWFAAQQRFHGTVRNRLRAIEVPADLKAQIIARRKIVPLRHKHFALCAAVAAIIVALLGIETLWMQRTSEEISFSGYQDRMVGFALREYRMDLLSEDPKEIRSFLGKKGAPTDYVLPSALDNLPAMGGAKLSWQGNPVSMLCYRVKSKEIAYVFVMHETALQGRGSWPAAPEFGITKGLNTATWKRGPNVYLFAAPLTETELKRLVHDLSAAM